jgi:hypothetical protein
MLSCIGQGRNLQKLHKEMQFIEMNVTILIVPFFIKGQSRDTLCAYDFLKRLVVVKVVHKRG